MAPRKRVVQTRGRSHLQGIVHWSCISGMRRYGSASGLLRLDLLMQGLAKDLAYSGLSQSCSLRARFASGTQISEDPLARHDNLRSTLIRRRPYPLSTRLINGAEPITTPSGQRRMEVHSSKPELQSYTLYGGPRAENEQIDVEGTDTAAVKALWQWLILSKDATGAVSGRERDSWLWWASW